MPELFKLRSGPWLRVFEGAVHGSEVEIYYNQKSVFMVAVYDKEDEKVTGVVVGFYKVFSAKGDTEAFVDTLPRELLFFSKHDKVETTKFLAVASPTSYISWEEEEFQTETDRLMLKVSNSSDMIKDVSKAYDLKLTEYEETPKSVKETFFSQPLFMSMLATRSTESGKKVSWKEMEKTTPGEVLLGLIKESQKVTGEPLSLLMSTIVSQGMEEDRMHAMQVLMEGALLANTPCIIFDWNKRFEGLGFPKKDISEFEHSKMDIEPIGFPLKFFAVGVQVQANIQAVNPTGLMQLFGAGEGTPAKILETALGKGFRSTEEVKQQILKTPATPELSSYEIHKAARILGVIEQRYPRLFDGENDMDDLAKHWVRAIGRASIIDLSYCDARQAAILVSSLAKEIMLFHEKKGKEKTPKAVLFMPEVQKLLEYSNTSTVQELFQTLPKLREIGIGFAASIPREIDLEKGFVEKAGAHIAIVQGNDVGVKIESRSQYRCILRPTLSEERKKPEK